MHQSYFINHLNLLTMKMLTAIEPLLCGFYTHIILCNYLTNSEVITIMPNFICEGTCTERSNK